MSAGSRKTTTINTQVVTLGNQRYTYVAGANIYVPQNGNGYYKYDAKTKQMVSVNSAITANLPTKNTTTPYDDNSGMEDGGTSNSVVGEIDQMSYGEAYFSTDKTKKTALEVNNITGSLAETHLYHTHNLFGSQELKLHDKTYRFGYYNPEQVGFTKEFLFFTRPDLHICHISDQDHSLFGVLKYIPYFNELKINNPAIIKDLEYSLDTTDPFNHLLQNQCISNLEVPSLSSEMVETATNMYGVGYDYRGSSEASDDKPSFSLEFKENKKLEIYHFFKAYEKYETIKHHGSIRPLKQYINDHVLHDQFAIFKIMVAEDMETIVYYGKMYGVVPVSLPRDVFNNPVFDNGLSYTIEFKAAHYEDMEPEIIDDFNELSQNYYNSLPYKIDIYNDVLDTVDNRPAQAAFIERVKLPYSDGFKYKLRWKGSDKI